jgi:hypothetical protein
MTDLLGNFCSSLMASGVTNTTVDFVVKEMEYSMTEVINLILKIAGQYFQNNFVNFSTQIKSLLSSFSKVKSVIRGNSFMSKTMILSFQWKSV